MTPSLMSDSPQAKGACYSNVFEEAAATYTHEMIHVVQMAFDFDHPTAVTEGLAQYDAYVHGTSWARTTGFWNNFEYAGRPEPDNKVISWSENLDRSTTLGTEDVYYGGLVLMKYYADRDGESVHKRSCSVACRKTSPDGSLGDCVVGIPNCGYSIPDADPAATDSIRTSDDGLGDSTALEPRRRSPGHPALPARA